MSMRRCAGQAWPGPKPWPMGQSRISSSDPGPDGTDRISSPNLGPSPMQTFPLPIFQSLEARASGWQGGGDNGGYPDASPNKRRSLTAKKRKFCTFFTICWPRDQFQRLLQALASNFPSKIGDLDAHVLSCCTFCRF